jgi:hypothetical protein
VVTKAQLQNANRFFLVNSVRGWVEATWSTEGTS